MEKMPDRYICKLCGYIANECHEICPACQDDKSLNYTNYGRKLKTKKNLTTDPNFQKRFGQMS